MKRVKNLILEDGVEKCFCHYCEIYHNCTEHFRTTKNKHGYSTRCKDTSKNYYTQPSEFTRQEIVKRECHIILQKLGYDLNSTIPVYEQFLIKHDL
jgi:hypothetical protein